VNDEKGTEMVLKNLRWWTLCAFLPVLAACGGGSDCNNALGRLASCGADNPSQPGVSSVPTNVAPKAVTTEMLNVVVNTKVELDGSNSLDDDRDVLSYSWTWGTKPANSKAVLNGETTPKPNFVPDVIGTYTLLFSVKDLKVSSPVVTVTVNVANANVAPEARAGSDQAVVLGNTLMLDGSGSRDANPADSITYKWEIKDKPEASSKALLLSEDAVKAYFVPDVVGNYRIGLIVNDGALNSDMAVVTITVSNSNLKPVADVGKALEGTVGTAINLDGSASADPNEGDVLSFSWAKVYAPNGSTRNLLSSTAPKTVFIPDLPGLYVFSLVVDDGRLSSNPAFLSVTVK
jgi:hypothetical protein